MTMTPVRRPTPEREWLDLYAELVTTTLPGLPAERLARQLSACFDASVCVYAELRDGAAAAVVAWPPQPPPDVEGHPLARSHRETGECTPLQLGVPGHHHLSLPLEVRPGVLRVFLVGRAVPFEPPEMAFAVTLWRLLLGLDRRVGAATGEAWPPVADPDPGLTPREVAVLVLLGDGLTASAIARQLMISVRTVHKHLERIYLKLGVADRLSAVLEAHRQHVL